MKITFKKALISVFCFATLIFAVFLWYHGVDNRLSESDLEYVPKYINAAAIKTGERTYEDEIAAIRIIQDAVLSTAPVDQGIPYGQERELAELYNAKYGLCFDRSRAIEKILRFYGFQTRHIFVLSTNGKSSAAEALFTREIPSHAISEVLTQKGWLVVGSNVRWLSLDSDGNPRSMEDVKLAFAGEKEISWKEAAPPIYTNLVPYVYIYGLYSRHGKFYPPYDFVPDVNYSEFADNLF